MATLVIRNVPDAVHARLKINARAARRSVNQEVVHVLEASVLPASASRTVASGATPLSASALEAALADTRYQHYASLSELNQYMDELRAERGDAR